MYAGHFAAGLALKAKAPKAPTWGILIGVGFLDLLFGPFVLLGLEQVSLTPGVSPGFSLDHIDWSHSLVMSLVWSGLFGALFLRWGRGVAAVMAVAAFSHFLLDLPMHPLDMALWPNSEVHLGFGLWRALPVGWWFVELVVVAAFGGYYLHRARRSDEFGRRPVLALLVVLLLHASNSPWLSVL
ncbi:MAG: hypothetical protein OEO79_16460 [Gemmatimonadota bacterium]|nr:hypothetical protein [Gemmatimonadota bacterium]